jgi:hypothetical protein
MLGGPDPIDGINAIHAPAGKDHLHFITTGIRRSITTKKRSAENTAAG